MKVASGSEREAIEKFGSLYCSKTWKVNIKQGNIPNVLLCLFN